MRWVTKCPHRPAMVTFEREEEGTAHSSGAHLKGNAMADFRKDIFVRHLMVQGRWCNLRVDFLQCPPKPAKDECFAVWAAGQPFVVHFLSPLGKFTRIKPKAVGDQHEEEDQDRKHNNQPERVLGPGRQREEVCRRAELLSPSRVDQHVAIEMAAEAVQPPGLKDSRWMGR